MKVELIEDWKIAWRKSSVFLNLVWGTAVTVFIGSPVAQQAQLLSLLGFDGDAALAAFDFFAKVAAAVAAATIAARVTKVTRTAPAEQ
jgi:hypothetical protein